MKTAKYLFAFFCLIPVSAWAGDGVGTVKELAGKAHITHIAAKIPAQDMKLGDPLFEHDVVETEEGARAIFKFADDAELVVTGKGKLVVDKYIYDAAKKEGNGAVFNILDTAFSYLGGLMDKDNKADVKLNMDYGAVGIRGTKVWGVMRNGLDWVYLEEGAADVNNKGGAVSLQPGFGTRLAQDSETPAPAYKWGDTEIAWIKHFVDDPHAQDMQTMASNISPRDLRAPEDASEAAPPAPGGGSANGRLDEELSGGKAAPAAPAASAPAPIQSMERTARAREAEAPADTKAKKAVVQTPPIPAWQRLNMPLWGSVLKQEGDELHIDTSQVVTVHLAEGTASASTIYIVEIKVLSGTATLAPFAHVQGARGWTALQTIPVTTGDWQKIQIPFALAEDQRAGMALDLVMAGKGNVQVKPLQFASPLK